MTVEREINLLFAARFDYPLLVDIDILGSSGEIAVDSHSARLELPRLNPSPKTKGLLPPASVPESLAKHISTWSLCEQDYAAVDAILVTVPAKAVIDFNLGGNQLGGEGLREIVEKLLRGLNPLPTGFGV